jgi:hypothetical protein
MKSANQLLQRYEIFCANRDTGCKNNEGMREAYAYSTFMSNEEKQRARYTHSLYENVHNYDYSICGTTFKYSDFLAGFDGGIKAKQVTKTFEFNLPYNDILPLSGINFFPNGVIGELDIKSYFSSRGLVYCMIDPNAIQNTRFIRTGLSVYGPKIDGLYLHEFAQVGCPATLISGVSDGSYTSKLFTFRVSSCRITQLETVQLGFRIQQSAKQALQKQVLFKFPAEQIQVATVSGSVDESGMNVGISTTLNNCTGISLLMNSHPNEITVYRNIMYRGVYMKVNDTQYPNKNMNTIGSVFYKTTILASDLEEYGLAPTEEFENSISIPRNDELGSRVNMTSDATNFIQHLQTERNGGG